MSVVTIFLLGLIGVLIPANALLWFSKKRNNQARPINETILLKNPGKNGFQGNEIQAIQQQLTRLEDYVRKNNGFLQEVNELKTQQEGLYPRIRALEEATIQVQNELNEIRRLKDNETLSPKKEKQAKSNRLKILEEYLQKT